MPRRINKAFSWKGFKYFAVKALRRHPANSAGRGLRRGLLVLTEPQRGVRLYRQRYHVLVQQTPVEDMQKAYELGAYINLDDATMVDFLDRVAGVPETVFCRYNPGGTFSLGESEEGFQVMDKPGDASTA